jgi:hypothetical protein
MSVSKVEVFFSHATADREHVDVVRGQIEAMGAAVYMAEHDPQAGRLITGKIDEAIDRASLVVVLLTSTSASSAFVQQEIGLARGRGKPVIPIVDSRIVATIDLAMLSGVEYIPLDVERPAEAMRLITARLQELVAPAPQLPAVRQAMSPAPISVSLSDTEKLLLLGALALLLLALMSSGGGEAAA